MKILHYINSKEETQVCLLHDLYSPRSHPVALRQGPVFTTYNQSPSIPTSSFLAILA